MTVYVLTMGYEVDVVRVFLTRQDAEAAALNDAIPGMVAINECDIEGSISDKARWYHRWLRMNSCPSALGTPLELPRTH